MAWFIPAIMALGHGAAAAGEAVAHGAAAAGEAVGHGAAAAGEAVGHGAEAAGQGIEHGAQAVGSKFGIGGGGESAGASMPAVATPASPGATAPPISTGGGSLAEVAGKPPAMAKPPGGWASANTGGMSGLFSGSKKVPMVGPTPSVADTTQALGDMKAAANRADAFNAAHGFSAVDSTQKPPSFLDKADAFMSRPSVQAAQKGIGDFTSAASQNQGVPNMQPGAEIQNPIPPAIMPGAMDEPFGAPGRRALSDTLSRNGG